MAEHDPQDKLNPSHASAAAIRLTEEGGNPIYSRFDFRQLIEALHAAPEYAELKVQCDQASEHIRQARAAHGAAGGRLNDLHDRPFGRLAGPAGISNPVRARQVHAARGQDHVSRTALKPAPARGL